MLAFGALISCHQAYSSDLVESPAGGASPSADDFILASYLSIPFLISMPVSEIAASDSSSQPSLFSLWHTNQLLETTTALLVIHSA